MLVLHVSLQSQSHPPPVEWFGRIISRVCCVWELPRIVHLNKNKKESVDILCQTNQRYAAKAVNFCNLKLCTNLDASTHQTLPLHPSIFHLTKSLLSVVSLVDLVLDLDPRELIVLARA